MSNQSPPGAEPGAVLQLANCTECGAYSFPANAPGCRVCGSPPALLRPVPCPGPVQLMNFVTVNTALAPNLQVPCVIGEVSLAPGVVEEAPIDADESSLALGMALASAWVGHGEAARWVFRPLESRT